MRPGPREAVAASQLAPRSPAATSHPCMRTRTECPNCPQHVKDAHHARTSRLILTVALRQKRRNAGRGGALTSNAAPRLTAMLHDDDVGGNAASSANASQSWRRSRLSARRIAVDGTGPAPIPTAWSVWNKGLLGLGKQTNKPYRVHLSDYADHHFSCWGRADSHAPANRAHAIQSNRQTEGGC